MSDPRPPEALELARQFEEEQARNQAAKRTREERRLTQGKTGNLEPEEHPNRNITAQDLIDFAKSHGCEVRTTGKGKESIKVFRNGRMITNFNSHPGNLSTGLATSAQKQIIGSGIK